MNNKQRFASLFYALGQFAYRHRRAMVVVWCLALIVLGIFMVRLPGALVGSGFKMPGEAADVTQILYDDFTVNESQIIVLFSSEALTTQDASFREFVDVTLQQLEDVVQPTVIRSPNDNPYLVKAQLAYAVLEFDQLPDNMSNEVEGIREQLANPDPALENIPVVAQLTGDPVFNDDIRRTSQRDLARAEMIGVPAALVILLFAFGSLVAAMVPLLIGVVAIVITMGLLFWFATHMTLSIFLLNVVPMIGLALSIDFALLLVNRFREELRDNGEDIGEAVGSAVASAGRAISVSGICVLLGLIALLFLQVEIFRTVALGGIIVVLLAVIIAITFLPAVLGLLGHRINRWTLLKRDNDRPSRWVGFAKFVMRHPVLMVVGAVSLLLIALLPIRNIEFIIPETSTVPADFEARIAYESIEDAFGKSELYPVIMIAQMSESVMTQESLTTLEAFVAELAADPDVLQVGSLFSYNGDLSAEQLYALDQQPAMRASIAPLLEQFVSGNKMLFRVFLDVDPLSKPARDWVRDWNAQTLPFDLLIGGKTKEQQEIYDDIYQKAPYAFAWILFSTFIILAFAFQSVLIPLKAIIVNILSLGATFGILVWVFQQGHLTDLLNFEPNAIAVIIPIFIFSLVFGLSMDYEVFLISRIHECYLETQDNDQAVLRGLTTTSRIITSAAAIIIVITGAFAFTEIGLVKQMGLGIALAIFIDATLVRMVLVPATMKLLGRWNWWPVCAKASAGKPV